MVLEVTSRAKSGRHTCCLGCLYRFPARHTLNSHMSDFTIQASDPSPSGHWRVAGCLHTCSCVACDAVGSDITTTFPEARDCPGLGSLLHHCRHPRTDSFTVFWVIRLPIRRDVPCWVTLLLQCAGPESRSAYCLVHSFRTAVPSIGLDRNDHLRMRSVCGVAEAFAPRHIRAAVESPSPLGDPCAEYWFRHLRVQKLRSPYPVLSLIHHICPVCLGNWYYHLHWIDSCRLGSPSHQ